MRKLNSSEIREAFLSYFEQQGHYREKSASLLPTSDPTILFTVAGMVPFKNVFTGIETRPYKKATTSQRCLRAGGKHNDLENVGFTGRHHTYFEMLGNFSFGDYFKKEAIHFAWDLVTNVFKIPKEKLYITIHTKDDQSFDLWNKQEKIPKDRIFRFDKDNFWAAGEVGPCGPCSEIFFDRGEEYNTGDPEKDCLGGDGDRFLEIYNLVFMEYNRDEGGKMWPLPKPSVDTGMGLERMTSVLQCTHTNYETDLFMPIIKEISKSSGTIYNPKKQDDIGIATQVIADHLRAMSFLIADGLLPSNEGAGYVLRRILRRAVRYGKKLGFTKPFLSNFVPILAKQMEKAHPVLQKNLSLVQRVLKSEEEKFFVTLERGLQILQEEMKKLKKEEALSGNIAFLLYDSFGFPLDLTQVITQENGHGVDEAGFLKCMEKQKTQSKKQKAQKGSAKELLLYKELIQEGLTVEFTGYTTTIDKGKLLALITEGGRVKEVRGPAKIQAIFSPSPFYGESGGQVGDKGIICLDTSQESKLMEVHDVKKFDDLSIIHGELLEGKSLEVGKFYQQYVTEILRKNTAKNHSSTHILHWALRKVLGTHVKQAGSLVNERLLRFDFTHDKVLEPKELEEIESLVNECIEKECSVETTVSTQEAAIKAGAIALFGEKYDDRVRVLHIGPSVELCGGTHVENTGQIRFFVITGETGIAAGTRRITALTGVHALEYFQTHIQTMKQLQNILRVSGPGETMDRVQKLQEQNQQIEKRLERSLEQTAMYLAHKISTTKEIKKNMGKSRIPLIAYYIGKEFDLHFIRMVSDKVRQNTPQGVIALAGEDRGKAFLHVSVSKDLSSRIHAGKIIQSVSSYIDGRGGGKAEAAQASGTKTQGLKIALEKIESTLELSYYSTL